MIKREDIVDLIDSTRLASLLGNKGSEIVIKEKKSTWKIIVVVAVAVAALCGIAFAVYQYFKKDYDDEFLDDFDDWDDDDFFDDLDVDDEKSEDSDDIDFEEE